MANTSFDASLENKNSLKNFEFTVYCRSNKRFISPYIYQGLFFSTSEWKAQGELIVWDLSQRPSVRQFVRPSTLSNMNISETSWPIILKFHQEHHWGGGLTALGFG